MRKFLVGFVSFAISFFSLAINVEAKSIEVKSQVEPLTITGATTDTAYESQWALQASKISDVWPTTTGSGVIVAVIDSGSGPNPDLDQNLLPGRSITRGRITDSATDVDIIGHGTHVAGIIAARSNNSIGIAGVAPNAQILPIRILDSRGDGSDSDLALAIRYASDQGARVINLSLGGTNQTSALQGALEYAASKGILVVAAAGNGGLTASTTFPAGNDLTIAVTAVDPTLNAPSFTQRGTYIDISAPGTSICSLIRFDAVVDVSRRCAGVTEPYALMSGTSMAAAFVSGVAALVFSAKPEFNAQQVREVIIATAQDIGEPGRDQIFGAGMIDAYAIFKALGFFPDKIVFPTVSSLGRVGQEAVGGTVQIPESERLQWYRCLAPGEATLTIPMDCSAIAQAQRNIYIPTRKDLNSFLRFGTLISIGGTPQMRFSETTPKIAAIWTTNTTLEAGIKIAVKDLIESVSNGAESARVISGSCSIRKNILTTTENGNCQIRIFAAAKNPYAKLARTVDLIVVAKARSNND